MSLLVNYYSLFQPPLEELPGVQKKLEKLDDDFLNNKEMQNEYHKLDKMLNAEDEMLNDQVQRLREM